MSESDWEQRMGARGRARREERERLDDERAQAEYNAHLADQRAAYLRENPTPPGDCHECYELAPNPVSGGIQWWHVWPEDQPFEDWVCRHACHGPSGAEQVAIAFG